MGFTRGLFGLALAILFFYFEYRFLALTIVGLAGFFLMTAMFSPGFVYKKIDPFLALFAHGTGILMTWLLLIPFFYLFFLPFRLLFRLGKRDAMSRFFDNQATSYWVHRDEVRSQADYERQF